MFSNKQYGIYRGKQAHVNIIQLNFSTLYTRIVIKIYSYYVYIQEDSELGNIYNIYIYIHINSD